MISRAVHFPYYNRVSHSYNGIMGGGAEAGLPLAPMSAITV
jgi:hypothetical protein